jgi:hypothetical protein
MPSGFADPPQRTQHSHPDEPRRRDSPPLVEAPSTEKNDLNSHSNSLELSGPTSITPTLESSEAETSTSVVKVCYHFTSAT